VTDVFLHLLVRIQHRLLLDVIDETDGQRTLQFTTPGLV
jgi:hypothetical protein